MTITALLKSPISLESRVYYSSPDFLVRKHKEGAVLVLRNGHREVKTTNRVARMSGFRKRGGLKKVEGVQYYELEERR